MTNIQKTKTNEKASFKEGLISYFKGVKSEWGKVTWPEKRQVVFETGVVIFVVAVFTVIVFLMDVTFRWLLSFIAK